MPTISRALRQAYELQDFTFAATMSFRSGLTKPDGTMSVTRDDAQGIAALVRSWEACQERVRIHRNKPLPGSLRPEKGQPKANRRPVVSSGPLVLPKIDPVPSDSEIKSGEA